MKCFPIHFGFFLMGIAALTSGCSKNPEGTTSARAALTPPAHSLVIPSGTSLLASLDATLATDVNRTGDPFVATVLEPVMVDGRTAVLAGAKIHGVLRDVEASGRVSGRARMTLTYDTIVDGQGKNQAVSTLPLTLQAASTTQGDVEKIAAGGVLGAIIGGVAGGGKGAAIGAGAGVGAGTILMLATKGEDLQLNAGQRLAIQLTSPANVQVVAQR